MVGLYLILPTLLVIFFSFLIVRAGAIAFMLTGLDQKRARFQALSSFTGTGFTTKESELIVNHPRRRQIASWLMILGNAGIVTVIVTATSSLVTSEGYEIPISIFALIVGVYVIYRLVMNTGFGRRWERFIEGRFIKFNTFKESTIEDLLHLSEGYGLVRLTITGDSKFINNPVSSINGVNSHYSVVGIEKGNKWLSRPSPTEVIRKGDKLIIYGDLHDMRQEFQVVNNNKQYTPTHKEQTDYPHSSIA